MQLEAIERSLNSISQEDLLFAWNLRQFLSAAAWPRHGCKIRRILSLACGEFREGASLLLNNRFFPELSEELSITGIDIRQREISRAREKLLDIMPQITELKYKADLILGDAAKLTEIYTPDDRSDLVIIRHQNYWNDPLTWTRIFEQALDQLNPTGAVLITSYYKSEHALALKCFEALGATVDRNATQACARIVSDTVPVRVNFRQTDYKYVDGYWGLLTSGRRLMKI